LSRLGPELPFLPSCVLSVALAGFVKKNQVYYLGMRRVVAGEAN